MKKKKNMGLELLWVWCLWSFLMVHGFLQGCYGIMGQCWEEERLGLLHLRPSFPFFLYWKKYDLNSDCCSWDLDRIVCDSSTGRVISLDMSRSTQFSYNYLNASLFLPFQHLIDIDLSENSIAGFLKDEGFERLSTLRNLERLYAGYNRFDNSILTSLKNLTSLRVLSLSDNKLKGSVHIHEINSLKRLTGLDLSHNSIESFEPSEGNEILNLPNLEELVLSNNYFNNSVLSFLRGLSSLTGLKLGTNKLAGSINVKEFTGLENLQYLDMGNNSIKGVMASKDGNFLKKLEKLRLDQVHVQACNFLLSTALFPSLRFLSLQYNTFNGCTIRTEITNGSTNLEELDLSGSSLPSNILHAFGPLPSLESLYMRNCFIGGLHQQLTDEITNGSTNSLILDLSGSSVPSNILHAFGPLPSLRGLNMRNCSIRGLHQQLIDGICSLTNLRELDMSWIEASGNLPACFSNLTALEYLEISHNQFRVPSSLAPIINLSKLHTFYASNTEIYDDHIEFNQSVPAFQLEILDLSGQLGLAGEFPKFLYHQHDLSFVHMSNTNLSGQQFPTWLLEKNPQLKEIYLTNTSISGYLTLPPHPHHSLSTLVISNNLLTGDIPPEVGGFFTVLDYIDISSNQFMGNIPSSLADMKDLYYLDLSNNKLSGGIPPKIASRKLLEVIRMQNNSLEGSFPEGLFNLPNLNILDLSSNFISGTIPSTFNLPMIRHIHLSSNKLHGGLPSTLCRSTTLVTLDLSNNLLVDAIPRCIEELHWLSYLILRNNSIKDTIPLQICKLTGLSVIDLSYNSFFGSIPSCLKITSHDGEYFHIVSSIPNIRLDNFLPQSDGIIFRTKSMSYPYNGKPLRFLIGIDLSSNKFTGEIPKEIGMLNMMGTLNLSHNSLSGSIPLTISNLKQIETLDLSFNNIGGRIPPQIVELTLLSSFNVSFNNLSGPTPQRVFQFANFEENSYKGNPFLCGEPLPKSCKLTTEPPPPPSVTGEAKDDGFMDMGVFYISLISSYITSLLAAFLVLWINPYWSRRWFYYAEVIVTSCYYYVVDHLPKCF